MLNILVVTVLLCDYSINGFSGMHSSKTLHFSVVKESTALWSSEVDDESAEEPVAAVESSDNDLDDSLETSETSSDDSEDASKSMLALLGLASSTSRGEFATPAQKIQAEEWIKELESANPTAEPTNSPLSQGTWDLVYSDTQLFRSSPFFMAGRAVCTSPEQAEQYDWFCDMHRGALAISQIGAVRQIVSENRLVSEFEVKAGAVPFLSDFTPFAYSGGWPVRSLRDLTELIL